MSLTFVSEQLLATNKLSHQDLYKVLGQLAERRIDYADLYFQSSYHEAWVIEDGIIKDGSYNIDQGVGVRAVSGEKTGFAYADQITLNALQQSAQAARSIVREQGDGRAHTLARSAIGRCTRCSIRCKACRAKRNCSAAPRRQGGARRRCTVQEVNASITGVYEQVLVAATDGTLAADVRPLVRLSVSVLVEQDGKRERGSSGGGGRFGYDYFLETVDGDVRADAYAKEAVRMALVNLGAVAAPAGNMPVVLGPAGRVSCCTKRWATAWKATSIGVAPRCSAAIWASWWLPSCAPWWMTAPCKARFAGDRRRRRTGPVQRADRKRCAERLHAGQAQRAVDGRRADRQRPSRVLRASADAAYDQHLYAGGPIDAGRSSPASSTACTRRTLAAARWTSPPASSCSPPPKPT